VLNDEEERKFCGKVRRELVLSKVFDQKYEELEDLYL
jgi:hypothetical protein